MRDAGIAPGLVPSFDVTVHIVLDDFGKIGRAYREVGEAEADLDTVIDDMLRGEFTKPLRVVAFNTSEGWSRDISEDVAWEVLKRARDNQSPLPASTRDFVVFHVGEQEALRVEAGLL
jgi:hypothetical protein